MRRIIIVAVFLVAYIGKVNAQFSRLSNYEAQIQQIKKTFSVNVTQRDKWKIYRENLSELNEGIEKYIATNEITLQERNQLKNYIASITAVIDIGDCICSGVGSFNGRQLKRSAELLPLEVAQYTHNGDVYFYKIKCDSITTFLARHNVRELLTSKKVYQVFWFNNSKACKTIDMTYAGSVDLFPGLYFCICSYKNPNCNEMTLNMKVDLVPTMFPPENIDNYYKGYFTSSKPFDDD